MARPSKYDPTYCDMLIQHMASGLSFESFAGTIGVSAGALKLWAVEHEEFGKAKDIGYGACLLWWERAGMNGLFTDKESKFNAAAWVFNMKNRFGWKDNLNITSDFDVPIIVAYDHGKPIAAAAAPAGA